MDRRLRFAAVILVQVAILAAIPWRQVAARSRGRDVTLRTAPVDPFSPFGGYYMTLAYEAERPTAAMLPAQLARNEVVFLVVEKGDPAWRLVGLSPVRPAPAPDRAVLRARWPWSPGERRAPDSLRWLRVPIESAGRFYLPEARAKALEAAMAAEWRRVSDLPWEERERALQTRMLVDLKVDDDGNVALVRLRFGDLRFEE